jgi:hypothetical protein
LLINVPVNDCLLYQLKNYFLLKKIDLKPSVAINQLSIYATINIEYLLFHTEP